MKKSPPNAPRADYLSQLDPNSKRIVFAGDSNTHANMSYNWTKLIEGDFEKVNAGINGDLSNNLLERIDETIASRPDYVCILIGTNDVNASMSTVAKDRYVDNGKIDANQDVSVDVFRDNLEKIIRKLQKETKAHIAVLSLPLIGEDLKSEANLRADEYSELIKKIAIQFNLSFVDIRKELKQYVQLYQKVRPPSYEKYFYIMLKSIFLHFYFGYSFDKLSAMNDMLLSHDQLHQNSISGNIIAKEVNAWIVRIEPK
ncbi:Lysophospholipase L1 [Spirosomataceae bacterium TFI 002]|nr:Lysophospholipase L1 [Spirosomataceae bacterium TFI 002]